MHERVDHYACKHRPESVVNGQAHASVGRCWHPVGQFSLHVCSPENLLGRADDKEQRHRQHARAEPFFHSIYRIDLRARERWKQPLAELVANPEYTPKSDGNADSEEHVFYKIPPFLFDFKSFPPRPSPEECGKGEDKGRGRHARPKIEMGFRPWREHECPKRKGDEDVSKEGNSRFFHAVRR